MKKVITLPIAVCFLFHMGVVLPPNASSDQTEGGATVYWAGLFPNTGSFSFARSRLKKRNPKSESGEDVSKKSIQAGQEYQALLADLNRIITVGGNQSKPGMDHAVVFVFWQLGQRIESEVRNASDERKVSSEFMEVLAKDLGIETRTLTEILIFYRQYAIISTVSPRLSWRHYQTLIRIDDEEQRRYYQTMAVRHGWDAEELERQVMKENDLKLQPHE